MSKKNVRPGIKKLTPYTPGKTPSEPGAVKLASNENPFGPSPKALEAIKNESPRLHVYPDQKSTLLREALAKKWGLLADNFIIGNGSDEIMQLIAATYLNAGEEVLLSENTFSTYEFCAFLFDGKPVFEKLKNNAYDLPALAKQLGKNTKLIFLGNPNNPTGTIFTQKELDAFMKKVPGTCFVVIDEAYAEFAESKEFPDCLKYIKEGRNVIVLRTFSKAYGLAGLRVGYGVAHPEIIKYLNLTKLPFNVNRLAQTAAVAALDDYPFLSKTLDNNQKGKKYLYKELDALGLKYQKTEANFIFVELDRPADELFLELMREAVIVRPLTSFGFPKAIRVSIGTKEQNERFIKAAKAILV